MKVRTRYTFEVTREDIEAATRRNSSRCAVATAIQHALPQASRVLVDMQTIRFTVDNEVRLVYLTPQEAQQYIIAFDAGDPIKPFRVSVRNPAWKAVLKNHRVHHYDAILNVDNKNGLTRAGTIRRHDGLPSAVRKRAFGVRLMRANRTPKA